MKNEHGGDTKLEVLQEEFVDGPKAGEGLVTDMRVKLAERILRRRTHGAAIHETLHYGGFGYVC